jgi:hypothetical protein
MRCRVLTSLISLGLVPRTLVRGQKIVPKYTSGLCPELVNYPNERRYPETIYPQIFDKVSHIPETDSRSGKLFKPPFLIRYAFLKGFLFAN